MNSMADVGLNQVAKGVSVSSDTALTGGAAATVVRALIPLSASGDYTVTLPMPNTCVNGVVLVLFQRAAGVYSDGGVTVSVPAGVLGSSRRFTEAGAALYLNAAGAGWERVDPAADTQQDLDLAALEGRVATLEGDMDTVEGDVDTLESVDGVLTDQCSLTLDSVAAGDLLVFSIDGTVGFLTADTDFDVGEDDAETAANLADAITPYAETYFGTGATIAAVGNVVTVNAPSWVWLAVYNADMTLHAGCPCEVHKNAAYDATHGGWLRSLRRDLGEGMIVSVDVACASVVESDQLTVTLLRGVSQTSLVAKFVAVVLDEGHPAALQPVSEEADPPVYEFAIENGDGAYTDAEVAASLAAAMNVWLADTGRSDLATVTASEEAYFTVRTNWLNFTLWTIPSTVSVSAPWVSVDGLTGALFYNYVQHHDQQILNDAAFSAQTAILGAGVGSATVTVDASIAPDDTLTMRQLPNKSVEMKAFRKAQQNDPDIDTTATPMLFNIKDYENGGVDSNEVAAASIVQILEHLRDAQNYSFVAIDNTVNVVSCTFGMPTFFTTETHVTSVNYDQTTKLASERAMRLESEIGQRTDVASGSLANGSVFGILHHILDWIYDHDHPS